MVRNKQPHDHFAIALKKGRGSCVFLNNDRRCLIYDNRPTYCRQFPFHFHVSDRIKAELDLSCRGVWYNEGVDATFEAKELAKRSDGRLKDALKEATAVYKEFFQICEDAGVMTDRSVLRTSVRNNIDKFIDIPYLTNVMNASLEEPAVDLDSITAEGITDMEDLNAAARDAAMDSMRSSDPLNVPVYCDGKWNWNLFMVKKDRVEWNVLDDDGDLNVKGYVDPNEIVLPVLDNGAKTVLKNYILTLNQRDSMMGFAFHTMDSLNYEDDMTNVYYGSLSVAVIDLMWRSSLLNRFMNTGSGENGMREAIIFYDMDRLDAPTIGAFV